MEKNTLAYIQANIKCKKGNYNAFGKFAYRSAADIYEAFKDLKTDLSLITTNELETLNGRLFIKAIAKLVNAHGEDIAQAVAYAEMPADPLKGMSPQQTTGASISYAVKYAMNGLFAIDESEMDPDSLDNRKEPAPKEVEYIRDKATMERLRDALIESGKMENFMTWAKIELFEDMNDEQFKVACKGYLK